MKVTQYCTVESTTFGERPRKSTDTPSQLIPKHAPATITSVAIASHGVKVETVPGFEIALSGREQVSSAICPSGTNVIGCHLIPSFWDHERWRHFYPDSSGSCTCYDKLRRCMRGHVRF